MFRPQAVQFNYMRSQKAPEMPKAPDPDPVAEAVTSSVSTANVDAAKKRRGTQSYKSSMLQDYLD